MSYKCLFEINAKHSSKIRQMHLLTALMNEFLDEKISVEQLRFFEIDSGLVSHLRKAIYGLKKAPQV